MGAQPDTDGVVVRLGRLAPGSLPVLEALERNGTLAARSRETGATVADSLLRVLTRPRAQGLDPGDVFWFLLERLHNPAANTQIVNVPFNSGRTKSRTCVSAARIFVLAAKQPGEYARMVEELTSPQLSFVITRTYDDPALVAAMQRWLRRGRFAFELLDQRTFRITVAPDEGALQRALLEHERRRYRDWSFDEQRPKNSRTAMDVLMQSAITNYALTGRYDSHADADRLDGTVGVPPFTFGYVAATEDILGQAYVFRAGPAAPGDLAGVTVSSRLQAPDVPDPD